jgi:hypothetical protein
MVNVRILKIFLPKSNVQIFANLPQQAAILGQYFHGFDILKNGYEISHPGTKFHTQE